LYTTEIPSSSNTCAQSPDTTDYLKTAMKKKILNNTEVTVTVTVIANVTALTNDSVDGSTAGKNDWCEYLQNTLLII
jgi:hypothetical protein